MIWINAAREEPARNGNDQFILSGLAMHNRRSELRMAANKKIQVILIDGSVVCLGALLDLSLLGARIHVPLRIEAGKKIELIFDGQQQRLPSIVVWNTETEIGISFDTQVSVAPAT